MTPTIRLKASFAAVAAMAMCGATSGCLLPQAGLIKREQAYRTALSMYSAVFQPGAKRTDVEVYLQAHKVPFRQLCCVDHETGVFADLVQIGRNHAGWPWCSGWTVNIAFVFSRPTSSKSIISNAPTDVLKEVILDEVPDAYL